MDKKLNFHKLISSIGIAAIALVGSLIGAPASNAAASVIISDSTWDANTASPAVDLTLSGVATTNAIDTIVIEVLNTNWAKPGTCPGFSTRSATWSDCGISGITNNGSAISSAWKVYDVSGGMRLASDFSVGVYQGAFTAAGNVVISLASGAFTTGTSNGSFSLKVSLMYNGGALVDSATATVTVSGGTPVYTITFDPNGGVAGSVTSRTQSSLGGNIMLLSNGQQGAPTKTGCTLDGWMATPTSNSWYINSRIPSADETLYAKWSGAGCTGGGSSQSTALVVRLPEWQTKAINSITKVIDQAGVKLIGGKIKLDGVTASDLKKVTLNGKEISVDSLNPEAPVLNIPAGAGTGDLVFTLANGGTWTFQNAVRYVEPIKAGKPMKLFNFDNGSTTVNSYQVAQIAAQTA